MKSVIETLMERRSIRRYEREPLTPEQIELIHDAIHNTPTSYNGQQFSVIEISDQELKEKLYNLTNQKQIKTCNRFYVFCIDYYKIRLIAEAKGVEMPRIEDTTDGLFLGIIDASLAMMNAITAAEACGLGTCPIGYTRTANPEAISKLLKLPKGVFIVCGLAVGVPRELPDMKPKQPVKSQIFENTYSTNDNELLETLMQYDATVSHYNRTRSGSTSENDWAGHIVSYYDESLHFNLLEDLRKQGFDIKK